GSTEALARAGDGGTPEAPAVSTLPGPGRWAARLAHAICGAAGRPVGGRRRAFRSLAGNRALVRVLAAYVMFGLTEAAVWIAMLVYAYGRGATIRGGGGEGGGRGGTITAGLVAVAQLVPAAIVAPVAASFADRRSPVVLLAGGYRVQAVAM